MSLGKINPMLEVIKPELMLPVINPNHPLAEKLVFAYSSIDDAYTAYTRDLGHIQGTIDGTGLTHPEDYVGRVLRGGGSAHLEFDNTDNFLNTLAGEPKTICLTVRVRTNGQSAYFATHADTSLTKGWTIESTVSGGGLRPRFGVRHPAGNFTITGTQVNFNDLEYHRLCLVFDPPRLEASLYADGLLEGTNTLTGSYSEINQAYRLAFFDLIDVIDYDVHLADLQIYHGVGFGGKEALDYALDPFSIYRRGVQYSVRKPLTIGGYASNTLALTQALKSNTPQPVVQNNLIFTQFADANIEQYNPTNILTINDEALSEFKTPFASDTLSIEDEVDSNILPVQEASNTLSFASDTDGSMEVGSASDSVSITDTAESNIKNLYATDNLTLDPDSEQENPIKQIIQQILTFTQLSETSNGKFSDLLTPEIESTLNFTVSAHANIFYLAASNTIYIIGSNSDANFVAESTAGPGADRDETGNELFDTDDEDRPPDITNINYADYDVKTLPAVRDTLTFSQTSELFGTEYNIEIEQELTIGQVLMRGVEASATSSITFSQEVLTRFTTEEALLYFNQIASAESPLGKWFTDSLQFQQSATFNIDRQLSVTHTLTFSDSGTELTNICLDAYGGSVLLQQGTSSTTLTFTYPGGVIIFDRTQDFGNTITLELPRAQNQSRSGKLNVFRDPSWVKQRILSFSISELSRAKAEEYLDALDLAVGRQGTFVDQYSNLWNGQIIDYQAPITNNGSCRNIVDVTFQGVLVG